MLICWGLHCLILCCLIFSAPSCPAEFSLPDAAWRRLHQFMLFHLDSRFHDARFLGLIFLYLRFWTFPTSCQGAWCPSDHVKLSDPLSTCYSVCSQSPDATPLRHPPYLLLPGAFIKFLLSDRLIWSSRCYGAWSSLPHATLLDLN